MTAVMLVVRRKKSSAGSMVGLMVPKWAVRRLPTGLCTRLRCGLTRRL